MSSNTGHHKNSFRLYFAICFFLALLSVELGLRFFVEPHSHIALHRLRNDAAYLFDLNPEHPEVNEAGFREAIAESHFNEDYKKIVFLGDSVTFGLFVKSEEAYPALLQKKISDDQGRWKVINAGINGYTLYNEFHFFKDRIKKMNPDIVVLALCLNDAVNPVIHWQEPDFFEKTPLDAYPRGKMGQEEARQWVEKQRGFLNRLFSQSAVLRFLSHVIMLAQKNEIHQIEMNGKKWPVHVADESNLSIQQLADLEGPEWKWLEKNIVKLKEEVESAGAEFVLVFLPLAYQLDPAYPIQPSDAYDEFCKRHKINCFDPLKKFLSVKDAEKLFMGSHQHHLRDIWHLSVYGHRHMADYFYEFLKERKWIAT